ncbi:MAG: substrate-binding domain-containing protein [Lachnospiraceae bacterium]
MEKLKRVMAVMAVLILMILLVLSSTDIVLKEQVNTVYHISVITNDLTDTGFMNYKSGMDQALKEWTADVNMISLYEHKDVEQQMELILREIENGAQVVIVFPVDSIRLTELLEENPVNVPVIYVSSWASSEKVAACIHANDYERGQKLARTMIAGLSHRDSVIYAFREGIQGTEADALYEGVRDACKEQNVRVELCSYMETSNLDMQVRRVMAGSDTNILLALDTPTLTYMLQQYRELENLPNPIYGNGYNNYILHYLSNGALDGITIHNDYDMGYVSVKTAVTLLEEHTAPRDILVDSYTILPTEVYSDTYEKILFPI